MQHTGVQTHGVMPKSPENNLALFYFPWVSSGRSSPIILPKLVQSSFVEMKSPLNCSPSNPNQGQAAAFLGDQTSSSDRGHPTRLVQFFCCRILHIFTLILELGCTLWIAGLTTQGSCSCRFTLIKKLGVNIVFYYYFLVLWIIPSTQGLHPILLGLLQRERHGGLSCKGLQSEIGEYSNRQLVIWKQPKESARERASARE